MDTLGPSRYAVTLTFPDHAVSAHVTTWAGEERARPLAAASCSGSNAQPLQVTVADLGPAPQPGT